MGREQGRAVIQDTLTRGTLERVPPSLEVARALVEVAERHLASAMTLADSDVVLAYAALHRANRKTLTAILLAQGLRPTRSGGHIAVYDAVHAQLEPPLGRDPLRLPPGAPHPQRRGLRRGTPPWPTT